MYTIYRRVLKSLKQENSRRATYETKSVSVVAVAVLATQTTAS